MGERDEHIATGRALSPGGELLPPHIGVSNVDGDGSGVDGDGSGGNSPSRQGAGTETSVPRNWSSMVAALWNFLWAETGRFRVFTSERIYRCKSDVRGWTRGPHHLVARPEGGTTPYGVPTSWPSSVSALDSVFVSEKIGGLTFILSNSENISCIIFLKYKNSRKHELALWHLVNRLIPENA
jgi:hypothetical protein